MKYEPILIVDVFMGSSSLRSVKLAESPTHIGREAVGPNKFSTTHHLFFASVLCVWLCVGKKWFWSESRLFPNLSQNCLAGSIDLLEEVSSVRRFIGSVSQSRLAKGLTFFDFGGVYNSRIK